jgi:hypothetical protein
MNSPSPAFALAVALRKAFLSFGQPFVFISWLMCITTNFGCLFPVSQRVTWIMFLKFLDDLEIQREEEAKLAGKKEIRMTSSFELTHKSVQSDLARA